MWLKMNGIEAARDSWARASGSTGTPCVHIFTGTPPWTGMNS
jgi:hypothetical protein